MKPKSDREAPEPMALILGRQKEVLSLPPYRQPWIDPAKAQAAARDYATLHNSDPFMHDRIMHYMRKGFELVSDVQKAATTGLLMRENAKRKEKHHAIRISS